MKCNVGKTERIVRIILALMCMALGAVSWKGFYGIGAVVFLTALIAWCPITAALGISTCREVDQEDIPADTVSPDKDQRVRDRRFK